MTSGWTYFAVLSLLIALVTILAVRVGTITERRDARRRESQELSDYWRHVLRQDDWSS